jgi:DNA-binding transcriptional MerR regulator
MDKIFRVGATADAIDRHPDTLRDWDRQGVFPAKRDSSGARYYTADDIPQLRRLAAQRARRVG